jgi:hypothetical protein
MKATLSRQPTGELRVGQRNQESGMNNGDGCRPNIVDDPLRDTVLLAVESHYDSGAREHPATVYVRNGFGQVPDGVHLLLG